MIYWCQAEETPSSSEPTMIMTRRLHRVWPSVGERSSRWWTPCMMENSATGWQFVLAKTRSCWRRASSPIRAGRACYQSQPVNTPLNLYKAHCWRIKTFFNLKQYFSWRCTNLVKGVHINRSCDHLIISASASTGLGQSSRRHWIEIKPINVACDEALKSSLLSLSEVWE